MPSALSLGLFSSAMFVTANVLMSSAPYTTVAYMIVLLGISLGLGWLVERLFWPIFDQQSIERQMSQTFRIFQELSDRTFPRTDLSTNGGDGSLEALYVQAKKSMRTSNKALKTATMTSSMPPSELNAWIEAIALQGRLFAHLLAISGLLQENRENSLLQELAPELSALGDSLSKIFAELSVVIVAKHPRIQLPNANIEFRQWQNRLTEIRVEGLTRSYNLPSRLMVGLIEHRLEGLMSETAKILSWLDKRRSIIPRDLPNELEPAQS